MVVAAVAVMKVAPELLVENLAFVSSMVVAKDVRRRTVPKVQKVILDSALPMVVENGASFQTAQRVLREAQSSARHMVEESAAHSLDAPEGLKVALYFVRGMVEASAVPFRAVVCAQRVHGGTQYCVAHGGGKRCASFGCTKSARGRTEYCVRHGGGKRCKFEGCTKSAQGSTDFCKAHGGGKRCSWGQADTSIGAGAQQCDRFVRSKTDLCSAHSALVQDHCFHGGGTLGSAIYQIAVDVKPTEMKVTSVKGYPREKINGDKTLVDRGISVPYSCVHPPVLAQSMTDPLPEGRVHGGGLLALLSRGGSRTSAGGSEL